MTSEKDISKFSKIQTVLCELNGLSDSDAVEILSMALSIIGNQKKPFKIDFPDPKKEGVYLASLKGGWLQR